MLRKRPVPRSLRENLARALETQGVAALQKGGVDEALPRLRRAAQLNPNDASNQYNLGLALLRKSSFDEAIAQFRKALALDPQDAQTRSEEHTSELQSLR